MQLNRKPIRALTVRQPWAWAIFHGKDVENRDWRPPHFLIGGYLAIHAGRTIEHDAVTWIRDKFPHLTVPATNNLATGAIVGICRLAGVNDHAPSPWFFGKHGWILRDQVEFAAPVPAAGQLRTFKLTTSQLQQCRHQWRLAQADGPG